MDGNIHSALFIEGVNTEHPKHIQDPHIDSHGRTRPRNDPEAGDQLHTKEREVTQRVEPAHVFSHAERRLQTPGRGEKAGCDHAPHAADHVHRNGVHCIVNLELQEQRRSGEVEPSRKDTNNESGPGFHCCTSRSNSDEAGEAAVHGGGGVPGIAAADPVFDQSGGEHGGYCGRGRRKGGVYCRQCGYISLAIAGDGDCGSRVEAIPAEPQGKCSQKLKRGGV
mmetsp:Transcript_21960/g.44057  ORF Transcript_21960/g.44057 Transcript_21960/m.44057 type:complete len:223 (-) Transcript_21960:426-1094(-)